MSKKFLSLAYILVILVQLMGILTGVIMTTLCFNLGQISALYFAGVLMILLACLSIMTFKCGGLLVELKKDSVELKLLKKVDGETDVHSDPVRRSRSIIS